MLKLLIFGWAVITANPYIFATPDVYYPQTVTRIGTFCTSVGAAEDFAEGIEGRFGVAKWTANFIGHFNDNRADTCQALGIVKSSSDPVLVKIDHFRGIVPIYYYKLALDAGGERYFYKFKPFAYAAPMYLI